MSSTPFTLYPAIDLKGGQVVRLRRGEMADATIYSDDPAAQAASFAAAASASSNALAAHQLGLGGVEFDGSNLRSDY
jgi:phosphoribosylformimino-5-aminoimidazole carboxamide ribotide isomerase